MYPSLLFPIIFGSLREPISALFALMILFNCFLGWSLGFFVTFLNFVLSLRICSRKNFAFLFGA